MKTAMFAFAAISPGLAHRATSEVPRILSPHADAISTVAILLIGLSLIAGAIRTLIRH
jgi:hypothetical protein